MRNLGRDKEGRVHDKDADAHSAQLGATAFWPTAGAPECVQRQLGHAAPEVHVVDARRDRSSSSVGGETAVQGRGANLLSQTQWAASASAEALAT